MIRNFIETYVVMGCVILLFACVFAYCWRHADKSKDITPGPCPAGYDVVRFGKGAYACQHLIGVTAN